MIILYFNTKVMQAVKSTRQKKREYVQIYRHFSHEKICLTKNLKKSLHKTQKYCES